MPRPLNNKRSAATMVATPSSLADVLGMGRTNLQEAGAEQQATTCTATPPPEDSHDIDVESEGGLSEDENESSILRRDILHDRQQAYRSVVAPSNSCTTAAAAAPTNNVDESDDDDEQSIPTRPASVDNQVPSAFTEAPESSSTPAKPIQAGGYTEDDWDRPTGQTSFWYDDARYYDHMYDAEMNGTEPSMHAFVSAAPLAPATFTPVPEEFESEVDLVVAAPKPRRVRASASGVYGQITYESESDDEELDNGRMGTVAPEPEDVAEGQFSHRQDTEPYHHHYDQDDQYNYREEAEYYAEQQEQHYYPDEEEEDTYNPDCPCEQCVDAFVAQQRRDIDTRWGHRFPQAAPAPQQRSHVVAPRSQQMQQQQMPRHPRGSKGGNPNAIVACCYFKQKGFCKMGPDCWYSHDADDSTPCHYGALCKAAGHKQLVKNGSNVQPTVQRPGFGAGPAPFVTHPTMPAMSTVIPRVRATVPANKPATAPRPAALLVPSVAPCAFCGASPQTVMTQEFPVYNGSTRTVGLRAHCTDCLRTYSL